MEVLQFALLIVSTIVAHAMPDFRRVEQESVIGAPLRYIHASDQQVPSHRQGNGSPIVYQDNSQASQNQDSEVYISEASPVEDISNNHILAATSPYSNMGTAPDERKVEVILVHSDITPEVAAMDPIHGSRIMERIIRRIIKQVADAKIKSVVVEDMGSEHPSR